MSATIKACVIGYPIKHSKSPIIHSHWLEKYKINGVYSQVEIHPDNLEQDIRGLIDAEYAGFNITIPHKEAILELCDTVDDTAKAIGAVNTVSMQDGKLHGYNTDAFGFTENLKSSYDFSGKALVLGAGGAARAVLHGLIEQGVEHIYLTNRTRDRAETLSQMNDSKITVIDWNDKDKLLSEINLLVNTTSLGMIGNPDLEIDLAALNSKAVVNDIVYAPLMTPLLSQAQKQGNRVVTGIGMLLHQARPAFEKWYGIMPDIDEPLEDIVLK